MSVGDDRGRLVVELLVDAHAAARGLGHLVCLHVDARAARDLEQEEPLLLRHVQGVRDERGVEVRLVHDAVVLHVIDHGAGTADGVAHARQFVSVLRDHDRAAAEQIATVLPAAAARSTAATELGSTRLRESSNVPSMSSAMISKAMRIPLSLDGS